MYYLYICSHYFRDAMRQKSGCPQSEKESHHSDSYLHPTSECPATSTPNHKAGNHTVSKDQYLTPLSFSEQTVPTNNDRDVRLQETCALKAVSHKTGTSEVENDRYLNVNTEVSEPIKTRFRRLRSISCEDLSDYLRDVVYDPVSKSMSDLLSDGDEGDYVLQEPFPRLQTFSGCMDSQHDHEMENYYNIHGLRGKIYDGPGPTVAEIRKKFSRKSQMRIRRSVSNPSFIGSLSYEKLNNARINIGLMSSKIEDDHQSASIKDILPDALRRHLNKEGHHKRSHGAMSTGALSSRNSSKQSSQGSSRASSGHSSPCNSLSRKSKHLNKDEIVAATGVKGINITKRSRSFRRHRPVEGDTVKENETVEIKTKSVPNRGEHCDRVDCKGDYQDRESSETSEARKKSLIKEVPDIVDTCINEETQHHGEGHVNAVESTNKSVSNGHRRPTKVFKKPTPAVKPRLLLSENAEHQQDTTQV